MATPLEERVAALETDVERLKRQNGLGEPAGPWWRRFVGAFENDPLFEEAVQRGREYRESLRPCGGEPL
jgi:hypothetical protein